MKFRPYPLPNLLCACALVAGLSFCNTGWCSDLLLADLSPGMAALQDFRDRASELASRALSLAGIRYRFGGNSPETGLDCSGLVRYVFREAWGANLPRTSEEISRVGQRIDMQELRPGDLVFYHTLRRAFSHVGIYLGNNQFIHSPARGGEVRVENMEVGYWKKRFDGARRIADPDGLAAPRIPQIPPVQ